MQIKTCYPLVRLGAFRDDPEEKSQVAEKMPNKSVDKPSVGFYIPSVTNPFSEAAKLLGSKKTPRKARAARENGKLGGRPPKKRKKKAESAA